MSTRKIYRIEIDNTAGYGPSKVGPWLAGIYMNELSNVTWKWKNSLGNIWTQEPDSSSINYGSLCACSTAECMLSWCGGRFEFEDLLEAGFELLELEVETSNLNTFEDISQAFFFPNDVISKRAITRKELTRIAFNNI